MRLVTIFLEKVVMSLEKMIPLVGRAIGGTFDVASTKSIAEVTKRMFVKLNLAV